MGSRRSQHARGSVVGFLALGLTGVFALGAARAQTVPAPPTTLPRAIPAPSFAVAEHHAANLGITYQLVPHGPAFGARLTRDAPLGSAASQLRLEAGDMIISLDGQLINRPEDVLAHVGRTDVVFINIRTGAAQGGVMMLPMQGPVPGPSPVPGPIEPLPPLGPFRLGITTVPVQVNWPLPGAPPGPVLGLSVVSVDPGSPAAWANIRPGDVILRANGEATPSNASLRLITARSSGVVSLLVAPGGRVDQVVLSQVDMRRVFMAPAPGSPAPVPSPPSVPFPAPVPAPTSPAPSASPPRPVPF